MSRLATLQENRTKAKDALAAYTDELELILTGNEKAGAEARAWTPDEETRLADAQASVKRYDTLIAIAEEEEREANEMEEQRTKKLGGAPESVEGEARDGGGLEGEVRTDGEWRYSQRSRTWQAPTVTIGHEPMTYSRGNPDNSFTADILHASVPTHRGFQPALARLQKHDEEVRALISRHQNTPEGRIYADYDRELRRMYGETRDMSTGSGSMGDFAPPLYFLPEYAPYRTYGRALIDQLKKMPLPETGLTFNVPIVTLPTQAINQTATGGENTSVSMRDMTASYQVGTLNTIVDNLLVSQQYLDRVGPGIGGDEIVRDDQQRQVNRSLNIFAWGQVFNSHPGVVVYNDGSAGVFEAHEFLQSLHTAKANVEKTDGTVAYPTHLYMDVDLWESFEGSYDSSNRPYVVPQGVAFNPLAVGDDTAVPEGYTGFKAAGLPAIKDQANWVEWNSNGGAASAGYAASSGFHVALVGAFDIASYWLEGPPVIRVLPQPYVTQLTVVMQSYVYCAYIPVYATAMQLVFGTGTASGILAS